MADSRVAKGWADRRYLLRAALSAVSFVILSLFRFPSIEAGVVERKLQQVSDNPFDPKNAKVARRILVAARAGLIKIDASIVKDTGVKFVQIAEHDPAAWPTVQAYLGYRSFLNLDLAPALTPSTGTSKYQPTVSFKPDSQAPIGWHRALSVSFAGGYANSSDSARLELLSKPQPEGSEFAFFILTGDTSTIVLDGLYMKHVIIRNADVEYSGGAIRLEDVYFVNCRFHSQFKLAPKSLDLSREILQAASTTFPRFYA